MALKEQIKTDTNNALKAGDSEKTGVLRTLQAEIRNSEIAKKTKLAKAGEKATEEKSQLNDEEVMGAISKEIKKRKDAIEMYGKGGRAELAEKEKKELEILSAYMPEQMGEEEIAGLVKKAIEQSGASSIKEMSKVMAILMPQVKGKADGSLVGKIVKEQLG